MLCRVWREPMSVRSSQRGGEGLKHDRFRFGRMTEGFRREWAVGPGSQRSLISLPLRSHRPCLTTCQNFSSFPWLLESRWPQGCCGLPA